MTIRRLLAGLAAGVIAVLGIGLALAGPASAHATVVSTSPTDGARLATAPREVTVRFDEQVTLGYLHVTNADGARVDTGPASHPGGDGRVIAATLRPGVGDGSYLASFRVISADSHPVAGVVRFVVGHGTLLAAPAGSTSAADDATAALFDVVRWVSYGGFALLGGAWLLLTVWRAGCRERRARWLVWTGWGAMVLGAVAELAVQGPFTSGRSPGALFDWSLIDATLATRYGLLHCARLLLLGALAVLLALALRPGRRARFADAAWPIGIGVALTFSAAGHADTTNPRWLSIAADAAHLCAMAAWIGGLALLLVAVLPRRRVSELRAVLPVVSRVAFTAVVVMAVTGAYAAWRGVGTLDAIFTTEYGLLVSAKVVGFAGLLALGNLSRVMIQRRLAAPAAAQPALVAAGETPPAHEAAGAPAGTATEPPPQPAVAPRPDAFPGGYSTGGGDPSVTAGSTSTDLERMRRSVLVEVVVAGLVLAATAVLVAQPRGKEALTAEHRKPVTATAKLTETRNVTVTVDPGVHGVVDVTVALGAGAAPKQVSATATEPSRQLGPIPVPLKSAGPGTYSAGKVNLPAAGNWVITVVVTRSQFAATTTDVTIHLY